MIRGPESSEFWLNQAPDATSWNVDNDTTAQVRRLMNVTDKASPEKPFGEAILEWAEARGYGEVVEFGPGKIIEQDELNDHVFIPLDGSVDIEYCIGDDCFPLATLPAGSAVGEISTLEDVTATASVSIGRQTKFFIIERDEFRQILNDTTLGPRAQRLIDERLLYTADFQKRLEEHKEEVALERVGGVGNLEASYALNVNDVLEDLEESGKDTEVRTFRMTGIHRETHEVKTTEFTVEYKKSIGGNFSIRITNAEGSIIPVDIFNQGKQASTGHVRLKEDAGFGFYSRILRYLLKDVSHISATVVEGNTTAFMSDYRHSDVAHSELATHSPLVAARKGFISEMPSGYQTHAPLDSYRVDSMMEMYLAVATDVERSIESGDEKPLMKIYGQGRAEILSDLMDIGENYRSGEVYRTMTGRLKELIDRQFFRIDELAREYPLG